MNEELKVVISAECGKLTSACDKAKEDIEGLADKADSGSEETSGAFGKIDAASLAMAGAIAAAMVTAIGAVSDFVQECVSAGDSVDKNSQKMQMSSQSYQAWDSVLRHGGTTIDSLKLGVKNITEVLGDLSMGADANTEAFDALGVSLYDNEGNLKSNEQVLSESILALSDMDDVTQRNALAQDIFGKSASELNPVLNQGSDAISEQLDYAKEYVAYSDSQVQACADVSDAQQDFNDTLDKLKMTIAENFLPAIESMTTKLTEFTQWCQENPGLVEAVVVGIVAFGAALLLVAAGWAIYTVAQWAANTALFACPLTWIILAIAAVIAAIILLALHWDEFVAGLKAAWDGVVQFFSDMWTNITGMFDYGFQKVCEFWDNFWGKTDSTTTSIDEKIAAASEQAAQDVENGTARITDAVDCNMSAAEKSAYNKAYKIAEDAKKGTEKAAEEADKNTAALADAVDKNTSDATKDATANFNDLAQQALNYSETANTEVTGEFSDMNASISQITGDLSSATGTDFSDMAQSITNSASTGRTGVNTELSGMSKDASAEVKAMTKDTTQAYKDMNKELENTSKQSTKILIDSFKQASKSMESGFKSMQASIKSTMTKMSNEISITMNKVLSAVNGAVIKMRSAMNFSWRLPHLAVPHVSISGSFSLNPASAPSFSVSWYQKGGVFDSPTLFNSLGNLGVLGENGAEAIVPLEKNTEWLDKLAGMLNSKMDNNRPIVMEVDGKTFAEVTVDSLNSLTRQKGFLPLKIA